MNHIQDDPSLASEVKWTLLPDFSNAFNSVDCGWIFEEVRNRVPSLSAWFESCYGAQPHLLLGKHIIHSCCGVQQGDPLGPLGFALALQPVLEWIRREVPGLLLNAWYLDDGTLCRAADDLRSALAINEEDGPPRGLFLNRQKSLLFVPGDVPFL